MAVCPTNILSLHLNMPKLGIKYKNLIEWIIWSYKCAISQAPAIPRHAIIHDESPVFTIVETSQHEWNVVNFNAQFMLYENVG
jgi:hypothetical protein